MLIVEDAMGEEALLEVEPEALDWVEFWRIGRQMDESDVVWRLEPPGDVPSGLVEYQDDMDVGGQALGEGVEIEAHHLGIGSGQDQGEGIIGAGADGAVDVDRLEALVGAQDWADALFEPDMGVAALLPDAGFVLEPELNLLAFMPLGDALYGFGEPPFLKAFWAEASA